MIGADGVRERDGARLVMMEGYHHGVPREVIAPVLADFFLGVAA